MKERRYIQSSLLRSVQWNFASVVLPAGVAASGPRCVRYVVHVCVCVELSVLYEVKLRGLSPRAYFTDRAAAAGRRS